MKIYQKNPENCSKYEKTAQNMDFQSKKFLI